MQLKRHSLATLFVVLIWPIKGCFDGLVNNKKRNVAAAPLANSKLPPPLAKTHHLIKETIVQQAQAAYNEKRFDDALDLYDQLVDEHPLWADTARVGKAKIFADAGEDMAALEAAEDALSSSGSIAGMSLLP